MLGGGGIEVWSHDGCELCSWPIIKLWLLGFINVIWLGVRLRVLGVKGLILVKIRGRSL